MKIIEQWKPVAGYEGLYEISNMGRVKSLGNNKSRKEKILKPAKDGSGYLFVVLCRNGKHKIFKVHRLVAVAFLPNPNGFTEINHINEDKTLNVVSNIEWCSRSYNVNYGSRNKRISKVVEASKYYDFRTIEYRFASTAEAGRNGFKHQYVSACCRGCYSTHRRNFYNGLYWRFASVGESTSAIMQRRQIEIFANVINNFKQNHLI